MIQIAVPLVNPDSFDFIADTNPGEISDQLVITLTPELCKTLLKVAKHYRKISKFNDMIEPVRCDATGFEEKVKVLAYVTNGGNDTNNQLFATDYELIDAVQGDFRVLDEHDRQKVDAVVIIVSCESVIFDVWIENTNLHTVDIPLELLEEVENSGNLAVFSRLTGLN